MLKIINFIYKSVFLNMTRLIEQIKLNYVSFSYLLGLKPTL
jgi:hypothetical protein